MLIFIIPTPLTIDIKRPDLLLWANEMTGPGYFCRCPLRGGVVQRFYEAEYPEEIIVLTSIRE